MRILPLKEILWQKQTEVEVNISTQNIRPKMVRCLPHHT